MAKSSALFSAVTPLTDFGNSSKNHCKHSCIIPNPLRIQFKSPLRGLVSSAIAAQNKLMETQHSETGNNSTSANPPMTLLFVEMGVGYDQHGQDVTSAAMRACRDAISSNSIPAFRRGSIPGVTFDEMKLQIKLGVPRVLQQVLDVERVKSVFPYGKILTIDVVDGGLICSSGVCVEEMGDKNDDCYIVNAAVYVGY
ncbi:hypothetical protein Sjap_000457 [Stephania japonica]|uniref:Uncharacterized protein n=1 Tax=Stephania japonica TaxID=461633 RepID=A0AAP0PQR8_9MAGN